MRTPKSSVTSRSRNDKVLCKKGVAVGEAKRALLNAKDQLELVEDDEEIPQGPKSRPLRDGTETKYTLDDIRILVAQLDDEGMSHEKIVDEVARTGYWVKGTKKKDGRYRVDSIGSVVYHGRKLLGLPPKSGAEQTIKTEVNKTPEPVVEVETKTETVRGFDPNPFVKEVTDWNIPDSVKSEVIVLLYRSKGVTE